MQSLRIYWQVISFKYHIVDCSAPGAGEAVGIQDSFERIDEFGSKVVGE